ncbi:MAG TPA: PAS domain-containing protein, partial [Rubrivivax sp.]|nr:PAS domain-containing protein [Rubrivivax sp.]
MPQPVDPRSAAARAAAAPVLDAATALDLLQQHAGAMALCDAAGHVEWCNHTLLCATGHADAPWRGQPLATLLGLAPADAQRLQDALCVGQAQDLPDMRVAVGSTACAWWRMQLRMLPDGRRVTNWQPMDELHRQRAQTQRLAELLDMAQDFGRLGVWERDVRTLQGRWDRHIHRFWGLSESDVVPDFTTAMKSVVSEDRVALEQAFGNSMRHAGSYAQRFRVRSADGVLRQLHSHWVVKDGEDGVPERIIGIIVDDTEAWTLARTHDETVEQLGLALELGHIVVFRHDLHTERVRFSDRAFDLLGLPRACTELSAVELREWVHPDDRPALRRVVEQAVSSGRPVDLETRFRHADGSWRHLLTRCVLQRDAHGDAIAVLGVGLDLSARVESSKRQLELVRQFELTAQAAGIGYWSVQADTGLARWSEQTFVLHGLAADAPALPMAQWLERFVHGDDRQTVQRRFRDWVKSDAPTLELELRIVRSDGAMRHVLSYSRKEGPSGHYDIFGVLMDVTDRRAAEAALHQASERAALATRAAGMGTWEQDLHTGQAHWDEQMWRLRGLQARATPLDIDERMALVHPDDRDATLRTLNQAQSDGRVSNLEFRVRWPDGQWRWIA